MMFQTLMSQTETATNIPGLVSRLHHFVLGKLTAAAAAVKLVIYRSTGCLVTMFECWKKEVSFKDICRCNRVI